jgi:hypothetical protein
VPARLQRSGPAVLTHRLPACLKIEGSRPVIAGREGRTTLHNLIWVKELREQHRDGALHGLSH